jgi:hypothetical protein
MGFRSDTEMTNATIQHLHFTDLTISDLITILFMIDVGVPMLPGIDRDTVRLELLRRELEL